MARRRTLQGARRTLLAPGGALLGARSALLPPGGALPGVKRTLLAPRGVLLGAKCILLARKGVLLGAKQKTLLAPRGALLGAGRIALGPRRAPLAPKRPLLGAQKSSPGRPGEFSWAPGELFIKLLIRVPGPELHYTPPPSNKCINRCVIWYIHAQDIANTQNQPYAPNHPYRFQIILLGLKTYLRVVSDHRALGRSACRQGRPPRSRFRAPKQMAAMCWNAEGDAGNASFVAEAVHPGKS